MFDLALVLQTDPDGLRREARFMVRHREAFLQTLDVRRDVMRERFDAIERLPNAKVLVPGYDESMHMAREFLLSI